MRILLSHVAADFGPRHGGRGRFGHPGLLLLGLLLLGTVIALVVVLFNGRHRPPAGTAASTGTAASSPAMSAEVILSERFARGEVSVEDFVTARAALRGEWIPPKASAEATSS